MTGALWRAALKRARKFATAEGARWYVYKNRAGRWTASRLPPEQNDDRRPDHDDRAGH